jgi:hypothetical protein
MGGDIDLVVERFQLFTIGPHTHIITGFNMVVEDMAL